MIQVLILHSDKEDMTDAHMWFDDVIYCGPMMEVSRVTKGITFWYLHGYANVTFTAQKFRAFVDSHHWEYDTEFLVNLCKGDGWFNWQVLAYTPRCPGCDDKKT